MRPNDHIEIMNWKSLYKNILLCVGILCCFACQETVNNPRQLDRQPAIYPDYAGVTIPATIAPLNFSLTEAEGKNVERIDVRIEGAQGEPLHVQGELAQFPQKAWQALLNANMGDSLRYYVSAKRQGVWESYQPFTLHISPDPIDYGVVYRKIAPGYEVYSRMGIYERPLSEQTERPLVENTLVKGMCVNCHAFSQTDPTRLSLHFRGTHGATLLRSSEGEEYLNTKTAETLAACVYPYWHPSGDYIAYSTNVTRQAFHTVKEERVEVVDLASDVLVYHPATHRLLLCDALTDSTHFETFPAFSPDGRKLYFCRAAAKPIPEAYQEIRYNLCSIDFDPEQGTFGTQIDTLIPAEAMGKSVSFPRPSYDGKYLMVTLSDYGNFSIWHREADLWLLELATGTLRPLDALNSPETESFHNWSSNSRWIVFSSRRGDGLYTRLYLAHCDEKGQVGKPFLLPQSDPQALYDRSEYSYNVPDFVRQPVEISPKELGTRLMAPERREMKAVRIDYSASK